MQWKTQENGRTVFLALIVANMLPLLWVVIGYVAVFDLLYIYWIESRETLNEP